MKETLQVINQDETIEIAGWPVQFLPIFNPLLEEAYLQALKITFQGVPTQIMQAVHLMAIMVQTGRPKDYARLLQFIEADVVDISALELVLARHGLSEKWKEYFKKIWPQCEKAIINERFPFFAARGG